MDEGFPLFDDTLGKLIFTPHLTPLRALPQPRKGGGGGSEGKMVVEGGGGGVRIGFY